MQVDKLIVIAGPRGVGKSYFFHHLQQGNLPDLVDQLAMGNPSLWHYELALDVQPASSLRINRLVMHYDITRPWKLKLHSGYSQDPPLRLLDIASEITLVTLDREHDVEATKRFTIR